MFKLKIDDVVLLKSKIESITQCDTWRTGYYKVVGLGNAYRTSYSDRNNPKMRSYIFHKVKKNGEFFPSKKYFGYNAIAFDKMIDEGKIVIIEENDGT